MEKINFINNQAPALNATNLNQLQTNIENAINGVVESGSNDNGSWIKYSDGTMICTKQVTANVDFSTPSGSLYEGNMKIGNYSQTFIGSPKVFVTQRASGEFLIEGFGSGFGAGSWGTLWLYSTTSKTNISCFVDVMAIGKWK